MAVPKNLTKKRPRVDNDTLQRITELETLKRQAMEAAKKLRMPRRKPKLAPLPPSAPRPRGRKR
jgi:hypothetical protein